MQRHMQRIRANTVQADLAPIVQAVLFGLEDVLAETASLHLAAWKHVLDPLLTRSPGATPVADSEFAPLADGLGQAESLRAFLGAHGISALSAESGKTTDADPLAALARQEQERFLNLLHDRGTHVFASSTVLVRGLRRLGIATAVISKRHHCAHVLDTCGLTQLFDVRLDGEDVACLGPGRTPEFALLMEAARRLGVPPERAAVVEDSTAGVEAAMRAGFALVIGLARRGPLQALELTRAGASFVVRDLAEVVLEPAGPGRGRLVPVGAGEIPVASSQHRREEWVWSYDGIDDLHEGVRETLCTLGNSYLGTRGAAAESRQDDAHYPGTYVAGCYNRLVTTLGDEHMENESIVNLPNWLVMRVRGADGQWLEPRSAQVSTYLQEVDLAQGIFFRQMHLTDSQHRRTFLSEHRIVHMAQPHLAAQKLEITATNWSGEVQVRAGLDAGVANLNVRDDRGFNSQHLVHAVGGTPNSETVTMAVETSQSKIQIHEAARIRVSVDGRPIEVPRKVVHEPEFIGQELRLNLHEGQTATVEKIVSIYTSRDPAVSEPGFAAAEAVRIAGSFEEILVPHVAAWNSLWPRAHLDIGHANANRVLRLHTFHLLQTLSQRAMDLDAGVPARGLHGEGYRGHIFWDDVLVLPLLTYRLPVFTRHLLGYRFRRLAAARQLAAEHGYAGALFPWQSGSDGREETPTRIFNPHSGRWFADRSRLQRHVGLAVAYEVWQYFEITNDVEYLITCGAELLIEIARFFSSLTVFNTERGRYEIRGVIGPDEFHDSYPGAEQPGIDNNAYTNVMVVWLMRRAIDTLSILRGYYSEELMRNLGVVSTETERWADITRKMFVPFHDGMISQFEGYANLLELDWDLYQQRYANIGRMDLILEAEGDSVCRYKVAKQADTLMLFYLVSAEELRELLAGLGYPLTPETILNTIDYYLARTSHGSTLSQVVDAWILARSDRRRSWAAFTKALGADAANEASSSTAEGIHLGAMAGTLDIVQRCYTGLEAREGVLWLNPQLPPELSSIDCSLLYRQQWLKLHITDEEVRVTSSPSPADPIRVGVAGQMVQVRSGETHVFQLPPASRSASLAALLDTRNPGLPPLRPKLPALR